MLDDQKQQRIKVTCPHCGKVASAPIEYAGRRVKCAVASCGQSFRSPPPEQPQATAAPVAPRKSPDALDDLFSGDDFGASDFESSPQSAAGIFAPTFASNPGNVPFNPLQWWRYQPLPAVLGFGFALLIFGLWIGLTLAGIKASIPTKDGGETPLWIFAPATLLTMVYFAWARARKFRSGDANPGMVVSLEPALVAVPTDLTQGDGLFPAVKIVPFKLRSAEGEPLKLGTRIPTVAQYSPPPHKDAGHWSDFDPVPAEYATSDQRVLERLLASFPEEQCDFLKHALTLIEQPYQAGLYAMWESSGKPPGRRIVKPTDF